MRAFLLLWILACAGLGAYLATEPVPEVTVRSVTRQMHSGRLLRDWPIGEGFRCEGAGLSRIDVLALPLAEPTRDGLVLVLHGDAPDGPVVREVTMAKDALVRDRRFLSFRFEPVEDSGDRTFFFELRSSDDLFASDWTVWEVLRGQVANVRPWGDRLLEERVLTGSFRALQPDLFGLGFPMERFDPREEPARLTVRVGDVEVAGTLDPDVPVSHGYATFTFAPIEATRFRDVEFELALPPNTQAFGTEEGVSFEAYYGPWCGETPLVGMTCNGVVHADRDLFFRAYTNDGRKLAARRLRSRAGGALVVAALAWIAGGVLLALAVGGRR